MANLRIGRKNLVPANSFNCLYNFHSSSEVRTQQAMVVLEQQRATCSGFPPVAKQVDAKRRKDINL